MTLSQEQGQVLLETAMRAVEHGVGRGLLELDPAAYPDALQEVRASFVTLKLQGRLRGCIGVIRPIRPLIVDVVHNAFAAANRDPRFEPVRAEELDGLTVSISILTTPEPLEVKGRQALLRALVPGRDGLILAGPGKRSTFLPVMWEQIPDPEDFVGYLEEKGGWTWGGWSEADEAWVFQSEYVA
jgi:uncharacterized protein